MKQAIESITKNNASPFLKAFYELAVEICQLPLAHQIAFFGSCCERVLPIYSFVSDQPGWGNIVVPTNFVNCLWKIAGSSKLSQQEITNLISDLNKVRLQDMIIDHPDDDETYTIRSESYYEDQAYGIARLLYLIKAYVNKQNAYTFINIFKQIAKIISGWTTCFFVKDRDELILDHEITQAELKKELVDINLLKEHFSVLGHDFLVVFRKHACPDGQTMLGSITEVISLPQSDW